MESFLVSYGLWAVFLLSLFEGDVVFVLAGVTVRAGLLPFGGALLAGFSGLFLSEAAWFVLGRSRSEGIRTTRLYRKVGWRVEGIARRIGPWELPAARLVYGTRVASMLYWGIQKMGFVRFAILDGLSGLAWTSILISAGFWAGHGAVLLLGEVKRIEIRLAVFLLVTVAVAWVFNRWVRARLERMIRSRK